jgi:hypothetical protein
MDPRPRVCLSEKRYSPLDVFCSFRFSFRCHGHTSRCESAFHRAARCFARRSRSRRTRSVRSSTLHDPGRAGGNIHHDSVQDGGPDARGTPQRPDQVRMPWTGRPIDSQIGSRPLRMIGLGAAEELPSDFFCQRHRRLTTAILMRYSTAVFTFFPQQRSQPAIYRSSNTSSNTGGISWPSSA